MVHFMHSMYHTCAVFPFLYHTCDFVSLPTRKHLFYCFCDFIPISLAVLDQFEHSPTKNTVQVSLSIFCLSITSTTVNATIERVYLNYALMMTRTTIDDDKVKNDNIQGQEKEQQWMMMTTMTMDDDKNNNGQ